MIRTHMDMMMGQRTCMVRVCVCVCVCVRACGCMGVCVGGWIELLYNQDLTEIQTRTL